MAEELNFSEIRKLLQQEAGLFYHLVDTMIVDKALYAQFVPAAVDTMRQQLREAFSLMVSKAFVDASVNSMADFRAYLSLQVTTHIEKLVKEFKA